MRDDHWRLNGERILFCFLAAPLVGCFAYPIPFMLDVSPTYISLSAYLTQVVLIWFSAFPLGLAVGAPTYLFLSRRGVRPTLANCMMAGGFVATLPWFLVLTFMPSGWSHSNGQTSYYWDYSAQRLRFTAFTLSAIAISGIIAGVAFWICIAWRNADYRRAFSKDAP